jgi:hypothetical protein
LGDRARVQLETVPREIEKDEAIGLLFDDPSAQDPTCGGLQADGRKTRRMSQPIPGLGGTHSRKNRDEIGACRKPFPIQVVTARATQRSEEKPAIGGWR